MLATTYVISESFESDRLLNNQKNLLTHYAKIFIEKYESSQDINLLTPSLVSHEKTNALKPPPRFSIYDAEGELIFGDPPRRHGKNSRAISTQSDSGNTYTVYARKPRMPHSFKKTMYRLNSVQFVFILFGSAVASALLSWSIANPLGKLSHFSRTYANDTTSKKLNAALLLRKDEIGDLAKDMAYMINQIEHTLLAQKQLLHDVSHELRAPLARLQASVGLIEQESNDEVNINRIHNELQNINSLIQRILDYSRIEQNFDSTTHFDFLDLINNTLENLKIEYPRQQFNIVSKEIAVPYDGYEGALRSAFENILQNACKYSRPSHDITINITLEPKEIIVSVKNTGPTINSEELDKILLPFYRAGNKMHTKGTGLGLSIANKAIKKNHGQLLIENIPEGGVVVTCKFPKTAF